MPLLLTLCWLHVGTSGDSKCTISVNADTTMSTASSVQIELLSSSGYRIQGWSKLSAVPIRNVSGTSLTAVWGQPSTSPHLETECHEDVKHCIQPWEPWPCTPGGKECLSVPTIGRVSCGGVPPVCIDRRCYSLKYAAPLCVKNVSSPPRPTPRPPSSKLPSTEHEVMVRAHLSGGAKLYAINILC
jgi:hypothetical protein